MWRPAWLTRRRETEIDDEIDAHLRMAIQDHMEQGDPPDEAGRLARIECGSLALAKEDTRAVWSWTALEQLATDLQIGARILWRAPAVSAAAVALIGLVVGGNTTIFSMVHAVLTKPAPGVEANGLVTLGWIRDGEEHPDTSYPDYSDVAAASNTIRPIAAMEFGRFILTTDDGSYAIRGVTVTPNYFETLGGRLAKGRVFAPAESATDADGLVAIISDRLWRDRFAASPDVIGKATTVNGHEATIVGVAAPGFRGALFGEGSDVWLPIGSYAAAEGRKAVLADRRSRLVVAMGRVVPGVALSSAQAEIATIAAQLPSAPGGASRARTVQLFQYSGTAAGDSLVAQRGPWFLAMFSIVTVLTVIIACANVANLMLARAVVRAREMAVRQSFGASRGRIVRIFVAEGLAIGTVAWAVAALFAYWTTRTIPRFIPPLDGSEVRAAFDFSPDWQVLLYAMLLALVGVVVVSAAPALRTCRQDLQPLLKAGGQGVVQGRSSASNGLVVLQLAFSVLLLTTAGLAYRSLSVLNASELGFDRSSLLLVTVNTKAAAPTPERNAMLLDTMTERLRAIRGIAAASYARRPVQSFWSIERIDAPDGRQIVAERNQVGAGYLRALGVTPIAGRDFESAAGGAGIRALVNQRLAATMWPGQPAIGATFRPGTYQQPLTVAGVIPDGFYSGYRRDRDANVVFVAADDAPPAPDEATVYVRYTSPLKEIVPAVTRTLRAVDDRAPVVYTRTMDEQLAGLTWPIGALAVLLASFALASLLVATIGQYAAMAFTIRRRIREFGVRIALGASTADILAGVTREGLRLTAIGLAIGCLLSIVAATSLRSLLFGVAPTDSPTYAGVVALLGTASLLACFVPAQRAARIDPMQALREE
jgi:predicted permease